MSMKETQWNVPPQRHTNSQKERNVNICTCKCRKHDNPAKPFAGLTGFSLMVCFYVSFPFNHRTAYAMFP